MKAIACRPGWLLDPRGALFLQQSETLVLADLHLGYSWAERVRGNLMPILAQDETAELLVSVVEAWRPRRTVIAGDIVHGSLPIGGVRQAVSSILDRVATLNELILIAGNHDRALERVLGRTLPREFDAGECLIAHGDLPVQRDERPVVLGHEHPALVLADDPATHVRCPCFLVHESAVVLPAFSKWAAGVNVRRQRFASPMLQEISFETAYASSGTRLLPVQLR